MRMRIDTRPQTNYYQFAFARIHIREINALQTVFGFEVLGLSKQRFDIEPFSEEVQKLKKWAVPQHFHVPKANPLTFLSQKGTS